MEFATPAGGYISAHRDSNCHQQAGLANKIVYITPNSAERIVAYVRPLVPPIVWHALRRVLGRP